MLDTIIKSLASETSRDLVSKIGVPTEKLDDLFKVTSDVAQDEIKNQVSKGGLDTVMNLFSKGENSSFADGLQNNLVNSLVSNFISKLGLSKELSNKAATFIVPTLINMITKENEKTPSDDASPLASIFSLGGKDDGGIGGMVKGLFN
jgi:hypothetical protein